MMQVITFQHGWYQDIILKREVYLLQITDDGTEVLGQYKDGKQPKYIPVEQINWNTWRR